MSADDLDATVARIGQGLQEAGQTWLLMSDGLDYINPRANDGSNDPVSPCRNSNHVTLIRDPGGYMVLWNDSHA